jgi:hypothetical protein
VRFVDDAQRLNVALTRAKRVLRVVGDLSFFLSLKKGSTLLALAIHAQNTNSSEGAKLKAIAWSPANWDQPTLWKATMTAKFHHCLKDKDDRHANVCFNTLLAVCLPDVSLLYAPLSQKQEPSWYMTCLKGCQDLLFIVWVARTTNGRSIIEAHFAGSRRECLRFTQTNPRVPDGVSVVKTDLSGVVEQLGKSPEERGGGQLFTSWRVNNNVQNAIVTNGVASLPQGSFLLDPQQEEIAKSPPPLLVESR